MERNYSKDEIEELILDLSSDNQEIADFAMSALLIANPQRHLSQLIKALEFGDEITRQRICYIFGGLADKRCVEPLLSILIEEPNIDTRLAAIDSLQYFPEKRILPYLKNQLTIPDEELHKAVISTLGVFIKHRIQGAHLPLIEVIQDEEEELELRHLALINLKYLEDDELQQVLETLKRVQDASIYSQILLLEDELNEDKEKKLLQVETLIKKLLSEKDILKQIKIQDQLVELGGTATKILVNRLFEEPENIPLKAYSMMIFDKLGNKLTPAFKSLLESFDRFDDFHQVILLQDLITIVAHRQYAALAPSLLKLLDRMNAYLEANNEDIRREFIFIKSDIHLALAKYGCREALDDLREIFKDGTDRQYLPLIKAVQYIGDNYFLVPLINQYHAYRDSKTPKSVIKKAFKAIVQRERLNKNDPMFKNLSELQKKNFELIF